MLLAVLVAVVLAPIGATAEQPVRAPEQPSTQTAPAPAAADAARANPEAAGIRGAVNHVRAARRAVVTANPIATEAALAILDAGGNAIDATVTALLVLNSTEPQSSGLGGGGFLLHWDAAARRLTTYDGRETAPAATRPDRFLTPAGAPLDFYEAATSARGIGVPGALALMHAAHASHGRLAWPLVVAPAIEVAAKGFAVSPRLHRLLAERGPQSFDAAARDRYFDATGEPLAIGTRLTNADLAATLADVQRAGPDALHKGPLAEAVVEAVAAAPLSLADMTLADLAGYRAIERPAVCGGYRGWKVCGMGPPSSGGVAVLQILAMLERFDLAGPGSPASLHLIAEASNLAFADRAHYLADPDAVPVPVAGLLDPAYLATRSAAIEAARAAGPREPGAPPAQAIIPQGSDAALGRPGTTHVSIVDEAGNAVSATMSIEMAFGSGRSAGGFLLNNQLTDFSFRPVDAEGQALANSPGPGKRPRSSMAPTMIFAPDGSLWAVLGSPGGSRIIAYVVKAIVGLLDWKLAADAVAGLDNFAARNGPFEIEPTHRAPGRALNMALKGHAVRLAPMTSGLAIIVRRPDGWEAAADPRREGTAAQ
ncbi:MAG: gamma-glutamyltransferase [Rhizobiales bacterium]|nr:gamma-glutamyltransferase [Hyphomicrobiales bacterium]